MDMVGGYVSTCYGSVSEEIMYYQRSDLALSLHLLFCFWQNMIDGAAFLGVGFDGRGDYSPESRKMSIVQRNCKNKAT